MSHKSHSFIISVLLAFVVLVPSFALAQTGTTPPPAKATHPNVTPPTKAPTKPLPPSPLPNGQMTVSVNPSGTVSPASTSPVSTSLFSNSAVLYGAIGTAIILLAGIGWFSLRRKEETGPEIEMPPS